MTHYILTIAGDGSRWGLHRGVRKHFVPIKGEPNLQRTIRLINANDKEAKIFIGINPKYPLPEYYKHIVTTYDGTIYKKDAESDRYFVSAPNWNREGRTVLIWGDVFFTENAIKTITKPCSAWLRYGRPGACSYSKRKFWGEEFAISFHPEHHEDMLKACRTVERISLETGIQLYGAIYSAMLGMKDDVIVAESNSNRKNNHGNMIEILDLTDDFDFPQDYEEFLKVYNGE